MKLGTWNKSVNRNETVKYSSAFVERQTNQTLQKFKVKKAEENNTEEYRNWSIYIIDGCRIFRRN